MLFGKSISNFALMLPNSLWQITGDTHVQGATVFVRQYINTGLLHSVEAPF
jgi:hypothetical protein